MSDWEQASGGEWLQISLRENIDPSQRGPRGFNIWASHGVPSADLDVGYHTDLPYSGDVEDFHGDMYIDLDAVRLYGPKHTDVGGSASWGGGVSMLGSMPIGSIVMFAGAASPDPRWAICDGSSLPTSDASYNELGTLLGTTYGTAIGSIVLPDLRDKFAKGVGIGTSLGSTVAGSKSITLTINNIPEMEVSLASHVGGSTSGVVPQPFIIGDSAADHPPAMFHAGSITLQEPQQWLKKWQNTTNPFAKVGNPSPTSFNIEQASLGINYIIKVKD